MLLLIWACKRLDHERRVAVLSLGPFLSCLVIFLSCLVIFLEMMIQVILSLERPAHRCRHFKCLVVVVAVRVLVPCSSIANVIGIVVIICILLPHQKKARRHFEHC